ncbi:MAG: hypothetical protein R3C16_12045 [Hyphomonadaceae bacterium]
MSALLSLADDIAADRRISAEEALHLRKEIFPDGVVSRQEAEVLIALNNLVAEADEAWAHAFVEALVDHALRAGPYEGHVDDVTADWLQQTFADTDRRELETMLKICEGAPMHAGWISAFHPHAHRRTCAVEGRAMDAGARRS